MAGSSPPACSFIAFSLPIARTRECGWWTLPADDRPRRVPLGWSPSGAFRVCVIAASPEKSGPDSRHWRFYTGYSGRHWRAACTLFKRHGRNATMAFS
ncbi:hypothetical protein KCP76_01760 [Salmonella enterica subsp. enterica serovar Weltevreden]|nr:hypothetical protein KCP76_01760 [Salmonella enterica subsp. enterica serovar Weltevreden]